MTIGSFAFANPASLDAELEKIRQTRNVVAVGAAVLDDKSILALGIAGDRQSGKRNPIQINDQWHLGSNTKAMTASLIAQYVENGTLHIEDKIKEVFESAGVEVHSDFKNVSVQDLLWHISGLKGDPASGDWGNFSNIQDPFQGRNFLSKLFLPQVPSFTPETKWEYSNIGYALAAQLLEIKTKKTYETLLIEFFQSLQMKSCGFGPPTADVLENVIWGHRTTSGTREPVNPTALGSDNPIGYNSAGRVHCNLTDWAQYARLHLAGLRGVDGLLNAKTIQVLHTPSKLSDYALGWSVVNGQPWTSGTAYVHQGSNTMWLSTIWIVPGLNRAFLVNINQADAQAQQATQDVILMMIQKYAK
jgi:D-alanyl-D-alanine carboxypeptidase